MSYLNYLTERVGGGIYQSVSTTLSVEIMHFNTQDRMTLQLKPKTAVHVCTGSIVKPVAVTPMHGSLIVMY